MKILVVCILFLLSFSVSSAQPTTSPILKLQDPYLSGQAALDALLAMKLEKYLVGNSSFVSVPLDYQQPEKGTMLIHVRLPRPLDPQKPTVLYFYGGPGGSSLGTPLHEAIPDFNVIYFDQRGTGLSKPTNQMTSKTLVIFDRS